MPAELRRTSANCASGVATVRMQQGSAPPKCKICAIDGRNSDHRLGSNVCPAFRISPKVASSSMTAQENISGSARRNESMDLGDGED